MASRVLRPHHLLETIPRASQRLWKKQLARGVHSDTVNSAFASQLDAVNVLTTGSGQERNADGTSLYSLFVSVSFVKSLLILVIENGVTVKQSLPQQRRTSKPRVFWKKRWKT